jgi:SAM-dependent methyltransferase
MDERLLVIERWKKKVEGIRFDPPIDYKLTFSNTLTNMADMKYSLLDIGTGAGRVIFENGLDKIYRKIVGIDIRPEMIQICKERAKGMKNVEFHVMDSTKQMDFKPGSFDVISAMFPPFNPHEVHRLLSPGGYFVLLSSLKGDHKEVVKLFPEVERETSGGYYNTVKGLNTALRGVGFKIMASSILRYKWIFKDEEILKEFYEKISFAPVFEGREEKLAELKRSINGSIMVTRLLCTTVAKKV